MHIHTLIHTYVRTCIYTYTLFICLWEVENGGCIRTCLPTYLIVHMIFIYLFIGGGELGEGGTPLATTESPKIEDCTSCSEEKSPCQCWNGRVYQLWGLKWTSYLVKGLTINATKARDALILKNRLIFKRRFCFRKSCWSRHFNNNNTENLSANTL